MITRTSIVVLMLLCAGCAYPQDLTGLDNDPFRRLRTPGEWATGNELAGEPRQPFEVEDSLAIPTGRSRNTLQSLTVSLAELTHNVPKEARKEAGIAEKALRKQNLDDALLHLGKALEIDPQYLAARKELGMLYIYADRSEKVIETFEEVLKIDPHWASAYGLIGAAYAELGNFDRAEIFARRALAINGSDLSSRFVLGLSLAEEDKNAEEALRNLRNSETRFPNAHLAEAHILAKHGHLPEARGELERYLPSAPAGQQEQIKTWIEELRN